MSSRIAQFGRYLIAHPMQAALLACAAALLPLVSLLDQVLVGFVTLSSGRWAGFKLALWALIPAVALAAVGAWQPFAYLLAMNVSIWLMAVLFQRTQSWSRVVEALCCLGLCIVLLVHWFIPDVGSYWLVWMNQAMTQAQQNAAASPDLPMMVESIKNTLTTLSRQLTGFMVVGFSLFGLGYFFLARAWQLSTQGKKGLRAECHHIRASRTISVLLVLSIAVSQLAGIGLVSDCLPVLCFPFLISGLSFLHDALSGLRGKQFILPVFYLLFLFLFPYVAGVLIFIGLIDAWLDLRQRFLSMFSEARGI